MRTDRLQLRLLVAAIAAAPLMLASMTASAARTVVEFAGNGNFPSDDFAKSGDAWVFDSGNCANPGVASSCGIDFTNGTSSALIGLGFSAKIGDDFYDSVYINSSGFLSFTSSAFPPNPDVPYGDAYQSFASIGDLGTAIDAPFIAPFYADLGITDTPIDKFNLPDGGASFFRGSAIPAGGESGDPALRAFAATWVSPLASNVYTQVVLYSTNDTGDFAFRLRYGQPDNSDNPPAVNYPGGLTGFSLGATTEEISAPSSRIDYFRNFVGGVFDSGTDGGGGVIEAPEINPASAASSITLLLGGLTVLLSRRRRPAAIAVA